MSYVEPQEPRLLARVLLVDDTELNRDIIGGILSAAGYAVDLASDGGEAVDATWSKAYDLVLMDIEMPGMNGFEAAARIRAREGVMSGVRIAALTATREPDAEQFSFWSGIDTFIPKPIDAKKLLARVEALIEQGAPSGDDWKPVWRLAVFARATRRMDLEETDDALDDFAALLNATADTIDQKETASAAFFSALQRMREAAGRLGFEEIAGLAARVAADRDLDAARCRDPNLLGAIDRARYAIAVYRREHQPTMSSEWWRRTRVNVRSLFRGGFPSA